MFSLCFLSLHVPFINSKLYLKWWGYWVKYIFNNTNFKSHLLKRWTISLWYHIKITVPLEVSLYTITNVQTWRNSALRIYRIGRKPQRHQAVCNWSLLVALPVCDTTHWRREPRGLGWTTSGGTTGGPVGSTFDDVECRSIEEMFGMMRWASSRQAGCSRHCWQPPSAWSGRPYYTSSINAKLNRKTETSLRFT